MLNIYKLKCVGSEYTFMVKNRAGNRTYVQFKKKERRNQYGYLSTRDEEVKWAIEHSAKFNRGEIKLVSGNLVGDIKEKHVENKGEDYQKNHLDKEDVETKDELVETTEVDPEVNTINEEHSNKVLDVFEDVKTFGEARKILNSEPYGIPYNKISNSEKVLVEAEAAGVSFPNLGK